MDLTTKHLSPSVTPPPLIVALGEPDEKPAPPPGPPPPPPPSDSMSKLSFEQMIRDKLVSLEPDKDVVENCMELQGETDNKRVVMARDDQEDPTGVFNCDQCDKTFTKKSSITRHKYEHSGIYN